MRKEVKLEELEIVRGLSTSEQETTISFMRDDNTATIYTCDNTMLTRIKKQIEKNPTAWKIYEMGRTERGVTGYSFICPKKAVTRISSGSKKVRRVSK